MAAKTRQNTEPEIPVRNIPKKGMTTWPEVGGCLLGLWGLDLVIVEAVSRHHQPESAFSDELSLDKLVFDANRQAAAGETTPSQPK